MTTASSGFAIDQSREPCAQTALQSAVEQRFEQELQRDRQLRRVFNIGTWMIALSTFATLYILIFPLGRTSPWLNALTLYSIVTRASAIVSWRAFLYPRFLLRLDDANPDVAAAAAAVLERHRSAVVGPILKNLWRNADAPAIAALDTAELASLAREYDVERQRRAGRRWLIVWCVLSLAIWGTVIATGGGPSE
jgi:hypothetical protein